MLKKYWYWQNVLPVTFLAVSSDHTTTLNEILQRFISYYLKYSILKIQPHMELNQTSQILQIFQSFSNKSAGKKFENCLETTIFTHVF